MGYNTIHNGMNVGFTG